MTKKIDELDKKLLALLARDGRMSSAEMARIVGAGERTVVNRVNKLIQSGAISIIGVIHGAFFGYEVMADIFCEVKSSMLNEVARSVAEFPEVRYVAVSFGDRDISIQVVTRSTADLHKFVTEKLVPIPG